MTEKLITDNEIVRMNNSLDEGDVPPGLSEYGKDSENSIMRVTGEERLAFTDECKSMSALYRDIFIQAEKVPPSYAGDDADITQGWKDKIEDVLAAAGYPVLNSDSFYPEYLENSEGIFSFWDSVNAGKDAETAFWGVTSYGGLYKVRLSFYGDKCICTQASSRWNEKLELELRNIEKREIYYWDMTPNEDFYYQDLKTDRHWTASKLVRLRPVSAQLHELYMKYIQPIGYHSVNLFLLDWDKRNYGELYFNDLLTGLYYADNKETLDLQGFPSSGEPYYHSDIPAELFEQTILPHFDITLSEFRERALYDPENNSYPWQPVSTGNIAYYPSVIPEVTERIQISEDTFKLRVRLMCLDYHSDCVLIHELTIRELPDGTWQYLENKVTFRDNVAQPPQRPRINTEQKSG